MIVLYLFIIVSFLLLALQKSLAAALLIIGAAFSLVLQYVWMMSAVFSLVVLILFLYHVVLIVILFTEQIPARLRQKRKAEIEEERKWAGKI